MQQHVHTSLVAPLESLGITISEIVHASNRDQCERTFQYLVVIAAKLLERSSSTTTAAGNELVQTYYTIVQDAADRLQRHHARSWFYRKALALRMRTYLRALDSKATALLRALDLAFDRHGSDCADSSECLRTALDDIASRLDQRNDDAPKCRVKDALTALQRAFDQSENRVADGYSKQHAKRQLQELPVQDDVACRSHTKKQPTPQSLERPDGFLDCKQPTAQAPATTATATVAKAAAHDATSTRTDHSSTSISNDPPSVTPTASTVDPLPLQSLAYSIASPIPQFFHYVNRMGPRISTLVAVQ